MESRYEPSDHLARGLKRLVDDIDASVRNELFGLEHVVCGTSELAGFSADEVRYRGIDVDQLVQSVSFEAVVWLLLTGHLPTPEEEADTAAILREAAVVEQSAVDALTGLPLRTRPLDMLPLAVSMLSYFDPTQVDRSGSATRSRVWRILAQLPVLLSAGLDGPSADSTTCAETSLAAAILNLVRGTQTRDGKEQTVSPAEDHGMNAVLICQALTEMRPACFTARFFGSTVGDVVPSLRSAASLYVAQMRNDPYEWMCRKLRSMHSVEQAEAWLLDRRELALPFGFQRRVPDPRSITLHQVTERLLGSSRRIHIAACAERLEKILANEDWHPTMDWNTSVVLTLLDVPPERASLAVALSRMAGWAAQAIDQSSSGVSLMPQLQYAME